MNGSSNKPKMQSCFAPWLHRWLYSYLGGSTGVEVRKMPPLCQPLTSTSAPLEILYPCTPTDGKPHQKALVCVGDQLPKAQGCCPARPGALRKGMSQGGLVPPWKQRGYVWLCLCPRSEKLILCKETRKGRDSNPQSGLLHTRFRL